MQGVSFLDDPFLLGRRNFVPLLSYLYNDVVSHALIFETSSELRLMASYFERLCQVLRKTLDLVFRESHAIMRLFRGFGPMNMRNLRMSLRQILTNF
jgi:hypothetical protein